MEDTMQNTMPENMPAKRRRGKLTFDKVNRRTHLYAAMFLLPWFFVYGLSSVPFSHPLWFGKGPMERQVTFDREYRLGPIPPGADLRAIGDKIQKDNGLAGSYAVVRTPEGNLRMSHATFWASRQLTYNAQAGRLVMQTDTVKWSNVLTRLHTRGGFERPGFLHKLWSVIVDVVQVAIIVWIASGLFMWWNLKRLRNWGYLALGAGVASFTFFLLAL